MSNAQAASLLSDERVEQNDLIAGVYEGGFKTWEGGMDLAQFLALRLQRRRQEQDVQQQQEQQQGAQQGPALELGPQSRVMELVRPHA